MEGSPKWRRKPGQVTINILIFEINIKISTNFILFFCAKWKVLSGTGGGSERGDTEAVARHGILFIFVSILLLIPLDNHTTDIQSWI